MDAGADLGGVRCREVPAVLELPQRGTRGGLWGPQEA